MSERSIITASALPSACGPGSVVDIAIVGAGPTGLFAAYYAGFRGLSTAVIDALPIVGGQVAAMYPEKNIADVAGFPAVTGAELISRLTEQSRPFDPTYLLGERVDWVSGVNAPDDQCLELHTEAGTVVRARTVIVAGGVGSFSPRPLPTTAGLAPSDVDSFVTKQDAYAGQHAVVVGGGDSALDWALALQPIAASVSVVHRRNRFRAHAHSVRTAQESGIRMITDAQIAGSAYGPDGLDSVEIEHGDGTRSALRCDRVVAALGFTARLGPILDWDLNIEHQRHIVVGTRMNTSRQRIFAAGDITTYDGKVPLISVGFGEAATAVSNACRLIHPEAPLFGGHSTEMAAAQSAAPVMEGVT